MSLFIVYGPRFDEHQDTVMVTPFLDVALLALVQSKFGLEPDMIVSDHVKAEILEVYAREHHFRDSHDPYIEAMTLEGDRYQFQAEFFVDGLQIKTAKAFGQRGIVYNWQHPQWLQFLTDVAED